ncbi:MAG: hypothetical protein COZ47_10270, partial [Lysobacterales bacterium CG_4_10_14_3_um_filter_64_11]
RPQAVTRDFARGRGAPAQDTGVFGVQRCSFAHAVVARVRPQAVTRDFARCVSAQRRTPLRRFGARAKPIIAPFRL